ncbi:MAG: DUF1853 family protein [Chitinophagales bacterium]
MHPKSRISSIIKANNLDSSVTDLPTFNLSDLKIVSDLKFELPTNLRLGHLIERIVAKLVESSSNFKILYENIQIEDKKQTLGEIDFIIEELATQQIIHLELAYKFYLFDPSISSAHINNWIGPNRNDSLVKKLDKLKRKQFPLLKHDSTKSALKNIEVEKITQALCFLVSLFIPYQYKADFNPTYTKAIKGYYLDLETFIKFDHSSKSYYLPLRKEWGIAPSGNQIWHTFDEVKEQIEIIISEKKAVLCWQKYNDTYSQFFITWW